MKLEFQIPQTILRYLMWNRFAGWVLGVLWHSSKAYIVRQIYLSFTNWIIRKNKYIYIVIHRQTCIVLSELFSVARQARFSKLGSKPGWLKRQSKILRLSHEENSTRPGKLYLCITFVFCCFFLHIFTSRLPRARFIWKGFHYASGTHLLPSLEISTNWGRGAYIVIQRQTCFVKRNN